METISKNINTRQGHFVTVMDQDRKKTMYSYLNTNKDTTTVLPQNDQYPPNLANESLLLVCQYSVRFASLASLIRFIKTPNHRIIPTPIQSKALHL